MGEVLEQGPREWGEVARAPWWSLWERGPCGPKGDYACIFNSETPGTVSASSPALRWEDAVRLACASDCPRSPAPELLGLRSLEGLAACRVYEGVLSSRVEVVVSSNPCE